MEPQRKNNIRGSLLRINGNLEISLSSRSELLIKNPHVTPGYARTCGAVGAIANFADTHRNGNTDGLTWVKVGSFLDRYIITTI